MNASPLQADAKTADGVLARLRAATALAHAELEESLDLLRKVEAPAGRLGLVQRFWGLHRGANLRLAPWLEPVAGLDYADRRRDLMFQADLRALGSAPADTLPLCPTPEPASRPFALGFFYVLEGSTLGGRVIKRELTGRGSDLTGLSFLDPYGQDVGLMWKRFIAVLEREAPGDDQYAVEDAVAGALNGFLLARRWLCS